MTGSVHPAVSQQPDLTSHVQNNSIMFSVVFSITVILLWREEMKTEFYFLGELLL